MRRYASALLIILLISMHCLSYNCLKPLKEVASIIVENNYEGVSIVIDAGHGGKDNGASANGFIEDELNLAVALKLKEILEMSKINVILCRDGDYDLSSADAMNHKHEDLSKRIELFEDEHTVMFVSIHMNKYSSAYVNGGQVFYRFNDDESKMLANYIQESFQDNLKSNKKAKVGNYYLLNNSKKLGVLVECGFLSNLKEATLLADEKYQTKLAYTIYVGIIGYLNERYGAVF